MKIDNSSIFTADIYKVQNSTMTRERKNTLKYGVVVGDVKHDSQKIEEDVIVIKFHEEGCDTFYIPVKYLNDSKEYKIIKQNPADFGEKILTESLYIPTDGELFIKGIKPLFSYSGKTSLSELIDIQNSQNNINYISGGMELKD